ncbi:LamadaC [Duck reovirus]|nr:LamadaC [Duck reovirus]
MAQIRGLRLSNSLSSPSRRKQDIPLTYDNLISCLKAVNKPWRPLRNIVSGQTVAIQLLFPLNGYQPAFDILKEDLTYEGWESWMLPRLDALGEAFLRLFPISEYHGRHVNVLLCNAIVAAYLSNSPFDFSGVDIFINIDPVVDLLSTGVTIHNHLWFDHGAVVTPAGCKFVAFSSYAFSPSDPCLFSKNERAYATVYYFTDFPSCLSFVRSHLSDASSLLHFDRPSNAIHCIVPLETTVPIAGTSPLNALSALLLESCFDQSRVNTQGSSGTLVTRQIESYLTLLSPFFARRETLEYGLFTLANALVNGYQLTDRFATSPTCSDVSSIVARLSDLSKPITVLHPRPSTFVLYQDSSMEYNGSNFSFLHVSGARACLPRGPIMYGKDVDRPVGWMPQFDPSVSFPLLACVDSLERSTTLPLDAKYKDFWSGQALQLTAHVSRSDAGYPLDLLEDFPCDYFSPDEMSRRAKFVSYRAVRDRSLQKDSANFLTLSETMDPSGTPVLPSEKTMLYVGASGTHEGNQPSVIAPLLSGELPGCFKPLSVRQIGWEVTNGTICDIEHPTSLGTFFFVYSDADQVQAGDTNLTDSSRRFCMQLDSLLSLVQPSGLVTVKCNFPTKAVWRHIFNVISPLFEQIIVTKPLLSNNLEVYFTFVKKFPSGTSPMLPSAAIVTFWSSQLRRYRQLSKAIDVVPFRGASLLPDYPLTVSTINFVDVTSLSSTEDQQALSCFSSLTALGSQKLSIHRYFDSYRTQLTGVVTPHSRRLFSRLLTVPRVFPTTITVQHRSMREAKPEVFGFSANAWTQLSMFYDASLSSLANLNFFHWLDCGTGPECRIVTFLPPDLPVTMVDTRPSLFPTSCWRTLTDYMQLDYLSSNVILSTGADVVSCVLSLGAACADARLPLIDGLRTLLTQSRDANVRALAVQLNCVLPSASDLPKGLLSYDVATSTYNFHQLGRVEPCTTYSSVLNLLAELALDCVVEVRSMDYSLSWLPFAIDANASITTSDIMLAMRLSQWLPLFIFHFDRVSVVFPPDASVGAVCQIQVPNFDPTAQLEVRMDDVVIGTIVGDVMSGFNVGVTAHSAGSDLFIDVTPSVPGVLSIQQIAPLPLPMGSIVVDVPDVSVSIVFPSVLDVSAAGTDIEIFANPWFHLSLFYVDESSDALVPVSDDKYDLTAPDVSGRRVLNWLFDRSDVFFKLVLCDVNGSDVGRYIYRDLPELSSPIWPSDVRSFLSLPFAAPLVVTTDDGPVLYDGFSFIPPVSWLDVDVSTCVIDGRPSFYVPPGHYGLVRV